MVVAAGLILQTVPRYLEWSKTATENVKLWVHYSHLQILSVPFKLPEFISEVNQG